MPKSTHHFHSWYDEFLGGGHTPDYGHFPLVTALENFVKALGEKYDGDNRIAFLHLGLLGFWYAQQCGSATLFRREISKSTSLTLPRTI
jgi:hypothetical protein